MECVLDGELEFDVDRSTGADGNAGVFDHEYTAAVQRLPSIWSVAEPGVDEAGRLLAIPVGLLALGLTMSRSGWIGAAVGLLALSLSFTTRQRLGLAALLVGAVVMLGVVTQVPEIDEVLSRRFASLNNLREDSSVNERVASQQRAVALFEASPFGIGLGADAAVSKNEGPSYGVAQTEGVALGDNGIEEVMLSFGWFGSLVFAVGFGLAVMACFQGTRGFGELAGVKAALVAMLVQMPVMGIFPGATGFLVWTSIALCFAVKAVGAIVLGGREAEIGADEERLPVPHEADVEDAAAEDGVEDVLVGAAEDGAVGVGEGDEPGDNDLTPPPGKVDEHDAGVDVEIVGAEVEGRPLASDVGFAGGTEEVVAEVDLPKIGDVGAEMTSLSR